MLFIANLFGNQSPSTLRSAGESSPFSGSGFSGGGSNVASTGFGVAKSQSPSGNLYTFVARCLHYNSHILHIENLFLIVTHYC